MLITISKVEARKRLVSHLGLARNARTTLHVLDRLRCIQVDPLDVIGTNADLVVMARVDGVKRGDVWRHLFPDHAFEHFAKERCILPEREQRVPPKLVAAVLEEIRERGPVAARELTDHGTVEPIDWAGWMGTKKA